MSPQAPRCSICRKPVAPRAKNASFPFCSRRCKLVDLGKWLGEEYRVPEKNEEREDEQSPDAPRGPYDA